MAEIDQERRTLVAALESLPGAVAGKVTASRRSTPKRSRAGGKRAPRGQRQAQFLTNISKDPGATMTEVARKMGVSPQQLYPIARKLEQDGAIVKSEKGYVPTGTAPSVKRGRTEHRGAEQEAATS